MAVYVKTKDLKGKGAYLEIRDHAQPGKTIKSKRTTGTKNWTRLSATVPIKNIGQPYSIISIRLEHEGKGISWFDELEVNET